MKTVLNFGLLLSIFLTTDVCLAGSVDFKLKDIDGKQVELNQVLAQGPALVSFWATWCHPCQDELSHIQEIYKIYSDSGLNFLAISIDGAKDKGRVKALAKGKGFTFPVLLDPEQKTMKDFGLADVPGLFIISAQGDIKYRHNGYKAGDETEIKNKILEMLRGLHPKNAGTPADTGITKTECDSL